MQTAASPSPTTPGAEPSQANSPSLPPLPNSSLLLLSLALSLPFKGDHVLCFYFKPMIDSA